MIEKYKAKFKELKGMKHKHSEGRYNQILNTSCSDDANSESQSQPIYNIIENQLNEKY